jgi:membrane-associated protein
MTDAVVSAPGFMDPMYWLGGGGVFDSAVLAGILIIVFIETGLLFPCFPATRCCSPVGSWLPRRIPL